MPAAAAAAAVLAAEREQGGAEVAVVDEVVAAGVAPVERRGDRGGVPAARAFRTKTCLEETLGRNARLKRSAEAPAPAERRQQRGREGPAAPVRPAAAAAEQQGVVDEARVLQLRRRQARGERGRVHMASEAQCTAIRGDSGHLYMAREAP